MSADRLTFGLDWVHSYVIAREKFFIKQFYGDSAAFKVQIRAVCYSGLIVPVFLRLGYLWSFNYLLDGFVHTAKAIYRLKVYWWLKRVDLRMKAKLHVPISVQQALEKIDSGLTKDKFIFSEEEATYNVQYSDNKAVKRKNFSKFWSRKDLGDKYPAHFSIVIEGTLEAGEGTIINVEIIEYHGSRKHTYSGTRAIKEYFDKFCTIFEAQ